MLEEKIIWFKKKINDKLRVQQDERMRLKDMFQAINNTNQIVYFLHRKYRVSWKILQEN
jgi:hypothetical protein